MSISRVVSQIVDYEFRGLGIHLEPDDLEFLDRGLRTFGLALATRARALPAVAGARLTENGLELFLTRLPPTPPAPFIAAEDDRVSMLARDAALPDPETMAGLLCPLPSPERPPLFA
jgi:hypothetical protein